MSDLHYICVEESIETAHEKCKSGVISTQFFKRLESILRDLKNADVEPVVRCKDCIESGSNMKRSTFCYLFGKEMDMDFYCANGKEKNA